MLAIRCRPRAAGEGTTLSSSGTARGILGRGGSHRTSAVLVAFWLSVSVAGTVIAGHLRSDRFLLDTAVYRLGAEAVRRGAPLYGATAAAGSPGHLAFTYPPFAAVFFGPLARLSLPAAGVVVDAVAVLAFCGALALVGAALGRQVADPGDARRRVPLAVAAGAVPVLLTISPMRLTLALGQVNTVLMVLVTADLLVPGRRWPRGVLTGIAAAIKLTPLAFLLVFAARRDGRGLLTAAGTFLAVSAGTWAALPADSRAYWSDTLFSTSRAGRVSWKGNECWRAALARTDLTPHSQAIAWVALSAATVGLGALAVRRATRAGDDVQALLAGGAVQLLVSPISWLHHWVWLAPGLLWWAVQAWRRRSVSSAALLPFALAFAMEGPDQLVPGSTRVDVPWNWWQQIVGNGFTVLAVLFLAAAALGWTAGSHPGGPATGAVRTDRATRAAAGG